MKNRLSGLFATRNGTPTQITEDHAACGTGMTVNIDGVASHQIVEEGLQKLAGFGYRSGYNSVTQESDGAGIRFYGLPTAFFQTKIANGEFKSHGNKISHVLKEGDYAVGQYFFPAGEKGIKKAKEMIERNANENGLEVVGWRNLDRHLSKRAVSGSAWNKKPALWQAILAPQGQAPDDLELTVLKTAADITNEVRERGLRMNIVSQSSESIIYKGMIRPDKVGAFYTKDLEDENFKAKAVQIHARFATNTNPQWANAQPCPYFIAHNGELNSRLSNAKQMVGEVTTGTSPAIFPNLSLSDSMQFDSDLTNQILQGNSIEESFVRLMSLPDSQTQTPQTKAMLEYFRLQRTPYNGPAFMVAEHKGNFIARLDAVGLRPSRWAMTADQENNRQFHAYSDDDVTAPAGGRIISKGELEPGGIIMITREGEILKTDAVLERINNSYAERGIDFRKALDEHLVPLEDPAIAKRPEPVPFTAENKDALQRKLYGAFWDYESVEDVVRHMAHHGEERVGAMGNDTNLLPAIAGGVLEHVGVPLHVSYFFHQLFAQVSAPPIDSIKERDRFDLSTALGMDMERVQGGKQIRLLSPLLGEGELHKIESHSEVKAHVLDTSFAITAENPDEMMRVALKTLLKKAEEAAKEGGVLILSDRNVGPERVLIPDMIAVAAVRKHLEEKGLIGNVSIVADSYQITGPHQVAALLAMGAKAVYTRGAYEKIQELESHNSPEEFCKITDQYCHKYHHAMEKSLLKIMGKMGITDINNYTNGNLVAALGLNLTDGKGKIIEENPSLANIFKGTYSPLKGIGFGHIAGSVVARHTQAYEAKDLNALPHFGSFRPENDGIKHGYGPEVVNAFTKWLKEEEIRHNLWRIHHHLKRQRIDNFITDESAFTQQHGFLDPSKKDKDGFYPPEYLEQFGTSKAFRDYAEAVTKYREQNPVSISDMLAIDKNKRPNAIPSLSDMQSQKAIRATLFSGSMSQGALTVSDPDTPQLLKAHETITQGMNAIGAMSASGEGGESTRDMEGALTTSRSKQIASGRFGISVLQLRNATEVEIKLAQGAKPGEGGQLPGAKVSVRFAAQRGSIPGTNLISPPPHHDIYSIEDLAQLIYDIKSVNPAANVAVKLVASEGIGTIAAGVAKAGANVINVAGNSGGTAAAMLTSIKHAGMPAELGLAEVDRALRQAGYRDQIKLRTSGGFKTGEDVIKAAILGADLYEFGTTAMLTVGCKMQRTCNKSCEPGVATDGSKFKGQQLNTERFFANIAASVQERLRELGFKSLEEIKGRTDLLKFVDPKMEELFDFSPIRNRSDSPALPHLLVKEENTLMRKDDRYVRQMRKVFAAGEQTFEANDIALNVQDRTFGARMAGEFYMLSKQYPNRRVALHSTGIAGQSYGAFNSNNMTLEHTGPVQDGCGKSMTGGRVIVKTPNVTDQYRADENTIAGNALFYGASGGQGFINGRAGHRFGVLMKGAQVVTEGAGDYPLEYMTSGTAMFLGSVGQGVGAGSSGGIAFIYDEKHKLESQLSDSVRPAKAEEIGAYQNAIGSMLDAHAKATGSVKAQEILADFDRNLPHFTILIPNELDKIQTVRHVTDILKTYNLREAPITAGMKVWLEQKSLQVVGAATSGQPDQATKDDLAEFHKTLEKLNPEKMLLSDEVRETLLRDTTFVQPVASAVSKSSAPIADIEDTMGVAIRRVRPREERVSAISGMRDDVLAPIMENIGNYTAKLIKDAGGCSTCWAQSCSGVSVDTGCPDEKPINSINAKLQQMGNVDRILTAKQWLVLRDAFELQIKQSPFIAYTGAACPAPCQDACTESIPDAGAADAKRSGKTTGQAVHIKDIEYNLYQLGRYMGWLDEAAKSWTPDEKNAVFGGDIRKFMYDRAMNGFTSPFQKTSVQGGKELVIVGSGPAAMQIAYEALRDGVQVRMYEKSNKPGGLLMDGIPAHKFDKTYIDEDFKRLQHMGLQLHLNSAVAYDASSHQFKVGDHVIAQGDVENQRVVLCLGAGAPKALPNAVTRDMAESGKEKLVQAVHFLKAANDIAYSMQENPNQDIEAVIKEKLGVMDPRGKKIVVVGGGDTAQDAIRWAAKYLNQSADGKLTVLVRGPEQSTARGVEDSYPAASQAQNKENALKNEEMAFIGAEAAHHTEPVAIAEQDGSLRIRVKHSTFTHYDQIQKNPEIKTLYDALPRAAKPTILETSRGDGGYSEIPADMVICALGFEGKRSIPLLSQTTDLRNVDIAGDAAESQPWIIVGAQRSGSDTYRNRIKPALNIANVSEISRQSLAQSRA